MIEYSLRFDTEFVHKKDSPASGDPFRKPEILGSKELVWVNTPYCANTRKSGEHGHFSNSFEVRVIRRLLESFVPNGEFEDELVILSPYKEQVERLKQGLKDVRSKRGNKDFSKNCYTVDSFQGRQAEPVLSVRAR